MDKRVSFDFDNTLSRPDIQEYAAELVSRGMENKKTMCEALKEYFDTTPDEQIQKDWESSCVGESSEFDVSWGEFKEILNTKPLKACYAPCQEQYDSGECECTRRCKKYG